MVAPTVPLMDISHRTTRRDRPSTVLRRTASSRRPVHRAAGQPVDLDEQRVRRDAALVSLTDVRLVGDALARAASPQEAAAALGVELSVLRHRIRHLSPMERAWLRSRLQRDDAVEAG